METVPQDLEQNLFGFAAPSEQQLSSIAVWAERALELRANIEQVEQHLSFLKKELAGIEELNLPQVLIEAGLKEFKLVNGSKITVKEVIQGGLSKDPEKRQATFDWVISEGGEGIIKDHFEIDYDKGQREAALYFRKMLTDGRISFDEFESIHAQTLHSFLREKLKSGDMPPFEDFGLRYFKKAEIKGAK